MRPARRPATSAPRPSWQKTSAAKIQAEIAKPRGAVLAAAVRQARPRRRSSAPKVAAAIMRCSASRCGATSVRSLKPEVTIHQPTIGSSASKPVATATCRPSAPLSSPLHQNHRAGRMNAAPMMRASRRWPHSHQKMALEAVERHVRIEPGELRDLLVAVELGLPFRAAQRRKDAGDRLPLGDGEAGFGQPRRAADQHHQKDEARDRDQPEADRPAIVEACGLGGGGRAVSDGHGDDAAKLLRGFKACAFGPNRLSGATMRPATGPRAALARARRGRHVGGSLPARRAAKDRGRWRKSLTKTEL